VGRQYRISIDGKNYYIDLVFYNIVLKCYVSVDLKTGEQWGDSVINCLLEEASKEQAELNSFSSLGGTRGQHIHQHAYE
jgi:hypothetical protein